MKYVRFGHMAGVPHIGGASRPAKKVLGEAMTQAAALVQIGQLLTKSGLLSDEELADALIKAKERNMPIGTVLLTMGRLHQAQLRAAVDAQSLVNDGVVSPDLAVSALVKSTAEGLPLVQALTQLGWQPQPASVTNKLGELLIDAGVINESELSECLSTGHDTGMPLGRVLIFKRVITEEILVASLRAQRLVREGLVPRAEAIDVLRQVHERKMSLAESLAEGGFLKNRGNRSTPVGYLLVEAGFLTDVNLMMSVELSLVENKPLVDMLVEQNFATKEVAQACLAVQQLVDAGTLTKDLASSALRLMRDDNVDIDRAVAQVGMPEINESQLQSLRELLVLSGSTDPQSAWELGGDFENYGHLSEKLASLPRVEESMIPRVVRALYLLDKQMLQPEDGVMALHYSRRNNTSLDEALTIMGWKPLAPIK